MRTLLITTLAMTSLASGATARTPIQVTRFHLDRPLTGGSIVPVTAAVIPGAPPVSERYAAAVARELARTGYTIVGNADAPLTYSIEVTRESRDAGPSRPPVTIGIGGGNYGRGGGIGLGGSFGIGGKRINMVDFTQLSVRIIERGGSAVWEGRAQIQSNSAKTSDAELADRLAAALFKGFPGESGRSITVR